MEFNNKLYNLRKQKGLSQEELAGRLNVSRQTVSKWEIGDTTPDMEKLVAISDLFGISLDELVLDKTPESTAQSKPVKLELSEENKKKAKKGLKIAGLLLGVVFLVDLISMIVYFILNGAPK